MTLDQIILEPPATVNVLPFVATVNDSGRVQDLRLTAYQTAKIGPIVVTVYDRDGQPVNLTAKQIALVAADQKTGATAFTLKNYGGHTDIALSGQSANTLTITGGETLTAAQALYDVTLWNVTDKTVLAEGTLQIKRAGQPT